LSIPDNDKLSAQVATAINADLLILLSDVDGLYTGPPSEHGSRLIKTYHPEHVGQIKFWSKSRVGRGGMESKVRSYDKYLQSINIYQSPTFEMRLYVIYFSVVMR
jgi:delta-1-pyrroline-5-carboxylate synthetase